MKFEKQGNAYFVMNENDLFGYLIKGSDGYYIYSVDTYIELECMDLVTISEKLNDLNEVVDDDKSQA